MLHSAMCRPNLGRLPTRFGGIMADAHSSGRRRSVSTCCGRRTCAECLAGLQHPGLGDRNDVSVFSARQLRDSRALKSEYFARPRYLPVGTRQFLAFGKRPAEDARQREPACLITVRI